MHDEAATERPPAHGRFRPIPAPAWVVLAWLPMLWWFAAFKPGIMTGDSLEIWRQATTGATWIDLHPPLYTAMVWLSDVVVDSPSLLALGQSLLVAAGIVAVGRALVRAGVNGRVAVAVAGIVACTPMVGAFSVTIWKDIPFTGALLLVGARLVDLSALRQGREREREARVLLGLALWAALAVALRQNGILVLGPVFVVLFVVLDGSRRLVAAAFGSVIVLLAAGKLLLYPMLDVAPSPPHSSVAILLHDIASIAARDPGAVDAEDRELLEVVAPFEVWRESWQRFDCHSANWQWDSRFAWANIDGRQDDYTRLWLEHLRENPRGVLGNHFCVGAVAWRPDNHGLLYTVSRGIDPNEFGLETTPLVNGWRDAGVDVLDALDDTDVQWLAWRAPGWLYLLYGSVVVVAWRHRRWWLLLPLALPVSLQLAVTALNPAQDARYMVPGLLLAWLLLPMAVSDPREPAVR